MRSETLRSGPEPGKYRGLRMGLGFRPRVWVYTV